MPTILTPERMKTLARSLRFREPLTCGTPPRFRDAYFDCGGKPRRDGHLPGIYLLFLTNGLLYVGQSLDVPERLQEHALAKERAFHAYSLRPVIPSRLDEAERRTIARAGALGIALDNHQFYDRGKAFHGEIFDDVFSPEEQDAFIAGIASGRPAPDTFAEYLGLVEPRYREDWTRFTTMFPDWPILIHIAREFVERFIPDAPLMLNHYWQCSLLDKRAKESIRGIISITCGLPLVFRLCYRKSDPQDQTALISFCADFLYAASKSRTPEEIRAELEAAYPGTVWTLPPPPPVLSADDIVAAQFATRHMNMPRARSPEDFARRTLRIVPQTAGRGIGFVRVKREAVLNFLSDPHIATSVGLAVMAGLAGKPSINHFTNPLLARKLVGIGE